MPSDVAQTSWSFAHATSTGVFAGDTSSVLPVAKVRTSILPPRRYARRSPAGETAGELTPSGAIAVAAPPLTLRTCRAPLPSTKYTDCESADHWTATPAAPPSGATCFSLSGFEGVGRGVGDAETGAGACVTNVMVCGVASCWLLA